jgi:YfiH family protein
MPFYQVGSIKYFEFSSLKLPGIYHAIFTRQGGVSPSPWKSLNFGGSVGDDLTRVRQNIEKALTVLNLRADRMSQVYQVHSTDIVIAGEPLKPGESPLKADGMITQKPGLALLMRFADCVPILLFDPVQSVIGIVHAGWLGTVKKIVHKAVEMMIENYETDPGDLRAGIGPSIGPDHYQIGKDVLEQVKLSFGNKADQFIINQYGNTFFDLWKANEYILHGMGVKNIEISGICTGCNLGDWYSHRLESGITGRFGAVIGLQ